MANMVIPDEGKIEWAKRALYGNAGSENLTLKLFRNNFTPVDGSTGSDFTEANFTGYAAKTLTSSQAAGTWAVPTTSSGIASSIYGTVQSWTATTDQTIYGWYIVGASSGKVYAAQKFPSAKSLVGADSDVLSMIPAIQFNDI